MLFPLYSLARLREPFEQARLSDWLKVTTCSASSFVTATCLARGIGRRMAHRTYFMIWQAVAVLASGKADCSKCASIDDWNDEQFEQCNVWGDPHVSDSWSPNGRFDFHGLGVYRYAKIDACGGGFTLDAFQCQHFDWKHAAVLFVGIKLNNGAEVFVSGTEARPVQSMLSMCQQTAFVSFELMSLGSCSCTGRGSPVQG